MPCRARVCPDWKTEPKVVVEPRPPVVELMPEPIEDSRYGVGRASGVWRGEKTKIRIQKKPIAQPEAAR